MRPRAALLDTEASSLTHVIGAEQIGQLPVNGRNFAQLAMLAPGVLPAFGHVTRDSGFNAHGQWAVQNNFILDGVDNNSHIMGLQDRKAQVLVPNLDAVQEFQIQTSNYTAEFGRGAGAVMNVSIKSGTNALHGTAHEFLRNDAFDARDAFDYHDRTGDGKADPDALRQNQFGFTIGGPIRRNRTFYFGSLEVTNIHTSRSTLATVPTLPERLGIFDPAVVIVRDPVTGLPFDGNAIPRTRWDPVAARMLDLWPEPNFADTTRANYVSGPANPTLRGQYDVRVDHNVSSRDRMFVRASWMHFSGERRGPFPGAGIGGGNNDFARDDNAAFNIALSQTHIFGSSLVHEARLGVNRLRTNKRPLISGFPNQDFGLQVDGADPLEGLARLNFAGVLPYAPLGEFQFNPNDKTAGTFQLLDNLSIAKGTHSVKLGVDLRWVQSNVVGAQFARGLFNFNGRFTGSSFADFLLGMTSSRQFSTIQRGNLRERNYMGYVQDDWRVVPRLTLNLGLRYELASPRFDTQDRMTSLDLSAFPEVRVVRAGALGRSWSDRALVQTDANNWAPRLGFAFQPGPLWTIRAAGGLFYGTPKGVGASRAPPEQLAGDSRGDGAVHGDPVGRPACRRHRPDPARERHRDAAESRVERLERRLHLAKDRAVELECAAAARPIVGCDHRLRRFIVAPPPAAVQHQRGWPGRSRHRARTPDDPVAWRDHDGRIVWIRQLPRAGNHGRKAIEPRRTGLALVHLEPFDRRRHRASRG